MINVNTSNCISSSEIDSLNSEIDSLKKAVKEVKGDVKDIDRSLRSEIKDSKEKLLEGIFQNQNHCLLIVMFYFFKKGFQNWFTQLFGKIQI